MTQNSFYRVGGTIWADDPSYVLRTADEELSQRVRSGEFCYVLSTRQVGKSSLMVRTAWRLKAEGMLTAVIDLTLVGSGSDSVTANQWYFGVADEIFSRLGLGRDLDSWWNQHYDLPPSQRLVQFLRDVVLTRTS